MEQTRITFPEVEGKSVAEISVLDDPLSGREVLVRFTDETQLSICVGMRQTVEARFCHDDEPDHPVFIRRD